MAWIDIIKDHVSETHHPLRDGGEYFWPYEDRGAVGFTDRYGGNFIAFIVEGEIDEILEFGRDGYPCGCIYSKDETPA
jgi:hypothetical protein